MLERYAWQGDMAHIASEIASVQLPKSWGDTKAIKAWATDHIPLGRGWVGVFEITGYHTPQADDGRATVFVSVSWRKPEKGREFVEGRQ